MKKIKCLLMTGCFLLYSNIGMASLSRHAVAAQTIHPWSLVVSIGFSTYQDMFESNGQTAVERLGFAKELWTLGNFLDIGIEAAVQNGNHMRLEIPQEKLDLLGGLPVESTAKPMLDLLATLETNTIYNTPLFIVAKGGAAFRQWQIDRDSVNDKSQVTPEVQVGIGCQINKSANFHLVYQGLFSGEPNFSVDPLNTVGSIAKIPSQNSLLLTLAINI